MILFIDNIFAFEVIKKSNIDIFRVLHVIYGQKAFYSLTFNLNVLI